MCRKGVGPMSTQTMPRRNTTKSPLAHWATELRLDDSRVIEVGDEFTVEGEGRFRLRAIRPNGELNAWGRITSNGTIPNGSMRTFKPEQVKRIHRVSRAIDTRREEEES